MIAENVLERIESAVREVNRELGQDSPVKSWRRLQEKDLFAELASCIIGSQITFEKAKLATDALRNDGLLSLDYLIENPVECEQRIFSMLADSRCLYANAKARYIVQTGINIYSDEHTTIKEILRNAQDQYEARDMLADLCLGIGLKQASLFLRNIQYADNLAILDTHVINYMGLLGIVKDLRKSLTRNLYLSYENELRSYSKKFNTSVAKLDVSIWVVMRTVSREFKWML